MNKDYFGIAERVIREKTNSRFSKGRQNHLTRSDFSIIFYKQCRYVAART